MLMTIIVRSFSSPQFISCISHFMGSYCHCLDYDF